MNCAACEKPLVRKAGEDPSRFRKRKCCNNDCRIIALRAICNKLDAAKREVPCDRCGKPIMRGQRRKVFACEECVRKRTLKDQLRYRHRRNEDARRYRVLMTALGWDSFDELMEYLKEVPWTFVGDQRVKDLRGAA